MKLLPKRARILKDKVIYVLKQPFFRRKQYDYLSKMPRDLDNITVMLVPGVDLISGGILSVFAFYHATKKVLGEQATVLMGTFPNKTTFLRYEWFRNDINLVRFNAILDYFDKCEHMCVHMPEYYAAHFIREINSKQRARLRRMKRLHINVMNQNIQLMPSVEIIDQLGRLSDNITITTAHISYTTPELRQLYKLPTHLLTAWFEQQEVEQLPYSRKENLMIVSPDEHPDREKILAVIRQAFPELEMVVIQNMKYDDYKILEAKAKWSISFGEGFDGYTVFPVLKGGVTFSVYNDDFFLPKYKAVSTFYPSYDALYENIVADMRRLDNASAYEAYNNEMYTLCKQDYSYASYLQRVEEFYKGEYTLP